MTLHDPELAEIIKNREAVEILSKQYYVEPARGGSCDGCAFCGSGGRGCPQRAVTICTSNGGTILVEKETN